MIELFIGFIMGYLTGNQRQARGIDEKQLQKYDRIVLKGVWQGQKEYLRIMIATIDAGVSVEDVRDIFLQQLDYCDQELAVNETKSILS